MTKVHRINSVPLPGVLVLALALFVRGGRDCSIFRVSIVGRIRGHDRWEKEIGSGTQRRTEDYWSNKPMPVMTQVALVVVRSSSCDSTSIQVHLGFLEMIQKEKKKLPSKKGLSKDSTYRLLIVAVAQRPTVGKQW